jgi:enamine deaminase RidA (YjgF/YER057c/UK114 family)
MTAPRVLQPKGWAKPRGYANGIVATGTMVFIAGQVGWDPTSAEPRFPPTFAEQFERALANVLAVLAEAGGQPEHLVRLTVYVTQKDEYLAALKECGETWKRLVGRSWPAMALVQVAGLLAPEAKVEMEGTAVLPP